MKKILIALGLGIVSAVLPAADSAFTQAVATAAAKPHPRLFATASDFAAVKSAAQTSGLRAAAVRKVLARADDLLDKPVLTRRQEGCRLLQVSRQALYRISHLAMAWRLTDDARYLTRAEQELKAVCLFSDWNPSHFLDVGEMCLAVAIGYDWLYDGLSAASRQEIADGLNRLGLQVGRQPLGWKKMTNNWGQVCRGGLIGAALALAETCPDDAAEVLEESVTQLPRAMAAVAPNGCYPEGPGYWKYGMSYNVYAIALLETACGSDFGLLDQPGFKETAAYLELVTGPSGRTIGMSDCSDGRGEAPVLWWFARRLNRPEVVGRNEIEAPQTVFRKGKEGWLPPLELLWMTDDAPVAPKGRLPLVWNPGGEVPVVIQRSSWDKDAVFVGLKGGTPRAHHGHMDGGNFVLEMGGVRWAWELPCESYGRLEQMGVSLWSMDQKSSRWSLFRLNSEGHSVPSIDGALQRVDGAAVITSVTDGPESEAVLDLTTLYPAATRVTRTGRLGADGKSYTLTDTFAGLKPGAVVRWKMVIRAEAAVADHVLTLTEAGRTLSVTAQTSGGAAWELAPAEGTKPLNTSNPGVQLASFTTRAGADGTVTLRVDFSLTN